MDVRCNRCGTDYEFDDDLISDRGTTVQCTNCGYQFKIYPERTAVMSPERWVVHTMAGRELAYTSLRDLQRAISENKVGPKDLLSRGNQAPRALGSIPELEPFFATTAGQSRGMQTVPRTLHGVAPPPSGTPRPPAEAKKIQATQRGFALPSEAGFASTLPGAAAKTGDFAQQLPASRVLGAPPGAPTERQPPRPESAPPKPAVPTPGGAPKLGMASTQRSGTLPDPAREIVHVKAVRVASVPPPKAFDATLPAASPPAPRVHTDPGIGADAPPNVAPKETRPGAPKTGAMNLDATMPVPAPPGAFAPLSPATQRMVSERAAANFAAASGPPGSSPFSTGPVRSSPRAAPTPEPPPISTRDRVPSYDELPLEEHVDPARRARSRWIAGVVFLAVAGLLGATLGRQYLVRLSTGQKAEPARHDERTARFLQEGTRLLDQADYEGAQAEFAKAQALSDRDPGVLAAVGRLETVRADLVWLKLRLLDPTAQDNVQATTRELTRRAGRARQAVDAAFAVAADDPVVVRSRIDAMRIAGEEAKAREWIAPIAANASDPQNAYVLAALDLSETAPAFSTVIDRLRAAAVSEHETLRARGALIYALVRAGRVLEAETELAKVTGGERAHPLAAELKAFVGRFSAALDGGVPAPAASASASTAAAAPSERASGSGAPGSGAAPITGDFRSRLTQASQASARGELTRAEDLYQSVVSEQPSNTEALAGLADVARRRGDTAGASRLYERVLDANPSYLPALMAVADSKWAAGDHAGAVSYYRRVLEQAGPSSDYGHRAQSRINDAEGANKAAPSAPAAPKPTATESPGTAPTATGDSPAPSRPDIDTTDLPGVKPP